MILVHRFYSLFLMSRSRFILKYSKECVSFMWSQAAHVPTGLWCACQNCDTSLPGVPFHWVIGWKWNSAERKVWKWSSVLLWNILVHPCSRKMFVFSRRADGSWEIRNNIHDVIQSAPGLLFQTLSAHSAFKLGVQMPVTFILCNIIKLWKRTSADVSLSVPRNYLGKLGERDAGVGEGPAAGFERDF